MDARGENRDFEIGMKKRESTLSVLTLVKEPQQQG